MRDDYSQTKCVPPRVSAPAEFSKVKTEDSVLNGRRLNLFYQTPRETPMTKTYPEIVSDLTKIIKLDQARGFDFYINGEAESDARLVAEAIFDGRTVQSFRRL